MSTLDKVEAELEINQQLATFALLVDGDGEIKRDFKAAVDKTFAANDVFDAYSGEGTLGNHVEGRDAFDQFAKRTSLPDGAPVVVRHFVTPTIFDEITPTTAKTRTASFVLRVSKNMIGPDCKKYGEDTCGGKVVGAYTYTYHDTWVKTAEGWQMSHIVVRGDE